MRYIMAEKDGKTIVAIWAKSQNLELTTCKECPHRDYLKAKDIHFADVISTGNVHINTATNQIEYLAQPWDGPKVTAPDTALLTQETQKYYAEFGPTLKDEIDADWVKYKEWKDRQEMAAKLYGYSK